MPSLDPPRPRYSRRALLGTAGVLSFATLGGCLTRFGRRLPVQERSESVRNVPRQSDYLGDDDPFAVLAVGDSRFDPPPTDLPHSLWVWNGADSARRIPVRLSLDDRHTIFTRDIAFPADGILAIDLLEAAYYRLTLGGDADDATVEVERTQFDCNDSATDIAVLADWSVEKSTITTTLGCGPF